MKIDCQRLGFTAYHYNIIVLVKVDSLNNGSHRGFHSNHWLHVGHCTLPVPPNK